MDKATNVQGISGRGLLKGDISWMNERNMLKLLGDIQTCHDEPASGRLEGKAFVSAFEDNIKDLCLKYQLTYKEPQ